MTYDTINDAQTIAGNGEGTLLAGRYRVVRQLGKGGMGSVWLVEDTQLDGKQFAIKMLPSVLVSNKQAYRQLKDEALVAMRLVHPNIVTLRAFEENNGNPFLVMDYIDGETLDDYLADYDSHVEGVESVGSRVPRDRESVGGHTPSPLRGTPPVSGGELRGSSSDLGRALLGSSPETGEVAAGRRGMTPTPSSPSKPTPNSPSKIEGVPEGRGSMTSRTLTSRPMNNAAMKSIRRKLRSDGTPAEGAMWRILKGRKIGGLRFRRQFSVGSHVLDFYCPSLYLAIELDGDYHYHCNMPEKDYDRMNELERKYGIRTLRFENKMVFENPDGIVAEVLRAAGRTYHSGAYPSGASRHLP